MSDLSRRWFCRHDKTLPNGIKCAFRNGDDQWEIQPGHEQCGPIDARGQVSTLKRIGHAGVQEWHIAELARQAKRDGYVVV